MHGRFSIIGGMCPGWPIAKPMTITIFMLTITVFMLTMTVFMLTITIFLLAILSSIPAFTGGTKIVSSIQLLLTLSTISSFKFIFGQELFSSSNFNINIEHLLTTKCQ